MKKVDSNELKCTRTHSLTLGYKSGGIFICTNDFKIVKITNDKHTPTHTNTHKEINEYIKKETCYTKLF